VRPRSLCTAYCSTLAEVPAFNTSKYLTSLKKLAKDERSSLFVPGVSDEETSLIRLEPGEADGDGLLAPGEGLGGAQDLVEVARSGLVGQGGQEEYKS